MSLSRKEKQIRLTVKLPASIRKSLERTASLKHISIVDHAKQVLERSCGERTDAYEQMRLEELIANLRRRSDQFFEDRISAIINEGRLEGTEQF
jgi:hypothetical protein